VIEDAEGNGKGKGNTWLKLLDNKNKKNEVSGNLLRLL